MRLIAKHCVLAIVATTALVSVAWASDAWKDKKPAEWTPKQLDKFMTSSPWSNTVQPASNLPMPDGSPGGPGGGGYGGGGGGGRGGGGGMGGGMGGAMPIMTYQIRWMSAPIMREALKLSENQNLSTEIERYANDYYIIGVQMQVQGGGGGGGPRPGAGRGGMGGGMGAGQGNSASGQGPSAQPSAKSIPMEMAMPTDNATLKFGRQTVHPQKATATSGMTLYMFPRSLKLEDAAKDYLFEVSQGQMTTRASFSLKGFEEAQDKGL